MQMNGNRTKAALIFLVLFLPYLFFGQAPASPGPRLTSDPRLAIADSPAALSGELPRLLDPAVFSRLSLVASGVDDAKIDTLMTKLDLVARDLKNGLPAGADERTKGEAVLAILYGRILTRYSEFQTRVDTALG